MRRKDSILRRILDTQRYLTPTNKKIRQLVDHRERLRPSTFRIGNVMSLGQQMRLSTGQPFGLDSYHHISFILYPLYYYVYRSRGEIIMIFDGLTHSRKIMSTIHMDLFCTSNIMPRKTFPLAQPSLHP